MQTILVTGGAGFIGSCFVRQCIGQHSARVVNLDKLTYAGNLDSLEAVLADPDHVFVQGDVADRDTVQRVFHEHEPTAVVHFAAESHVDRSIDDPGAFVRTNVEGTFQMLDAARQYWKRLPEDRRAGFRFLHVSTDEVYGSLGPTGRFTESSPYDPSSPYSASKAAADHFARAYFRTYGLPVLVTNCSNNYGPCQFPEKLLPLMILNAVEGKPLPVYGDGQNVRDWLYVEDHCRALECVLAEGQPGETYNIGGNAEQTNLAVVRMVCRLVDELRPGLPHAALRVADCVRAGPARPRPALRHRRHEDPSDSFPGGREHDFPAGLRRTVAWYLDNPRWVQRVSSGAYQRERLGLSER